MIIYHIDIEDGVIKYDAVKNPKLDKYHAPSAKQYFQYRNKPKPEPVKVQGWPFKKMYITHGTEENGCAVAWSF